MQIRATVGSSRSRRVGVLVAVLVLAGCSSDDVDRVTAAAEDVASDAAAAVDGSGADLDERTQGIVDALRAAGLETFASTVAEVDFAEVTTRDEFTLLAPDDEAFLSLTADQLADLTADDELLVRTLRAHVVEEVFDGDDLGAADEVTTAAGTTLEVGEDEGEVTVGPATVLETDVEVGDAVVHVVDALLPAE